MILMLLLAGCEQVSDLVKPQTEDEEIVIVDEVETEKNEELEEPKTKIVLSKILNMRNEWTIMGDYSIALTKSGKKDRVLLATSARAINGEMLWDDSQYWTCAVLTDDGAYNLFYQRLQGMVYAEVNEAYIHGISTPVVTVYAFSETDRDIRNYVYDYDEDVFVEDQIFTTRSFSTGGINTIYSTFPEYKPR
jgi:CDP-diacylglycerol pyrophosphatase